MSTELILEFRLLMHVVFHVEQVLFVSLNIFKIARYCCPMLTKLGVSRKIFVKVPNIIFYGNLSIGNGADTFRPGNKQTDIRDEANRRFSIFVRTLLKNSPFSSHSLFMYSLQFLRLFSYTAITF
jgi:hypothetical protein